MKKNIWLALILMSLLVGGCASPAPTQHPANPPLSESNPLPPSETPLPTPTFDPQTVVDDLLASLPGGEGFFKHCVRGEPFPVWNGMIGEFFGWEYETLLDDMGRIVGVGTFYTCTPENTTPQIFVFFEEFKDEAGAVAFYQHPFPPEFRQNVFEAKDLELPIANQARIRWNYDVEGESEETFQVIVEFQVFKWVGTIHTTGILDNFPAATAKTGARFMMENLYEH